MLGSYARQGHLAPVPSVFQGRPVDPMSEMGSSVRDRIPSIGAQQSTLGQYSFSNAKAMTQFKVFLRVLTAEHEEHPIRTLQLPVNIGRAFDMRVRPSPMNGLFNSSYLSRNHAIIKIEAGKLVIEDLGSCNGTFVNGNALPSGETFTLNEGDLIQFGSEDESAENSAIVVRVCFSENTAAAIPGVTKAPISLGSSLSKFNKKIESSYKHESFNSGAKHSTFSLATNHDTITALSDYSLTKEIASRRIEAISRELSVIESSLRNRTELSAEHLPVLDSILTLLYEHRRETAVGSSDISNRFMALNSNQTFYQRPTLAAAVKIITLYEFLFCFLAFCLAIYFFPRLS